MRSKERRRMRTLYRKEECQKNFLRNNLKKPHLHKMKKMHVVSLRAKYTEKTMDIEVDLIKDTSRFRIIITSGKRKIMIEYEA